MRTFLPRRLLAIAHRRFALLVVAVLAGLAFPLAEAWRQLGLEVEAVWASRRGLEPVRLAAQTQHALAAHRSAAATVLDGNRPGEAERLRRQRLVDEQMAALAAALELRRLPRALSENDHLRQDWLWLLEDLDARRLTPAASDTRHQLLIEQAYVVGDLAAADSRLHSQLERAVDGQAFALAGRELPRLAAALTTDTAAAAGIARRVARALEPLPATDAQRGIDVDELQALLALQQRLHAFSSSAAPAARDEAAEPLRQAALRAGTVLLGRIDRDLAAAAEALGAERRVVASALALDVLLVMLAAARVRLRGPRRSLPPQARTAAPIDAAEATDAPVPDPACAARAAAESAAPVGALLQRLRQASHDPDTISGGIGQR